MPLSTRGKILMRTLEVLRGLRSLNVGADGQAGRRARRQQRCRLVFNCPCLHTATSMLAALFTQSHC
jgi:hypothetical protein